MLKAERKTAQKKCGLTGSHEFVARSTPLCFGAFARQQMPKARSASEHFSGGTYLETFSDGFFGFLHFRGSLRSKISQRYGVLPGLPEFVRHEPCLRGWANTPSYLAGRGCNVSCRTCSLPQLIIIRERKGSIMPVFPFAARTAQGANPVSLPLPASMRKDGAIHDMQDPESLSEVRCSGHILLVDDDAGIRSIMERILRSAGYVVTSVADGEAGWAACCARTFDLVITDYEMPLLSGLGLLRRMRLSRQSMPAILVSGNLPWSEPDLPQLLMYGTTLPKPFSTLELLAAVRGVAKIEPKMARRRGIDHC